MAAEQNGKRRTLHEEQEWLDRNLLLDGDKPVRDAIARWIDAQRTERVWVDDGSSPVVNFALMRPQAGE